MPTDPYLAGLIKENLYAKKSPVNGELVAVLRGAMENRGLELIHLRSRAVLRNEVHELILTDERSAAPGKEVNRISYIGFVVVQSGGVLLTGDEVRVGGRLIGYLVGYDLTHMPNHMNLVIYAPELASGEQMELELGEAVSFSMPPM